MDEAPPHPQDPASTTLPPTLDTTPESTPKGRQGVRLDANAVAQLEAYWKLNPNPSKEEYIALVEKTNLAEPQIRGWFSRTNYKERANTRIHYPNQEEDHLVKSADDVVKCQALYNHAPSAETRVKYLDMLLASEGEVLQLALDKLEGLKVWEEWLKNARIDGEGETTQRLLEVLDRFDISSAQLLGSQLGTELARIQKSDTQNAEEATQLISKLKQVIINTKKRQIAIEESYSADQLSSPKRQKTAETEEEKPKKKKKVSWAQDEHLVTIHYFAKAESMDTKDFMAVLKNHIANEKNMIHLKKQKEEEMWRKRHDEMKADMAWIPPPRIAGLAAYQPTETPECVVQQERIVNVFMTVYYDNDIPPTPQEEHVLVAEYDDNTLIAIPAKKQATDISQLLLMLNPQPANPLLQALQQNQGLQSALLQTATTALTSNLTSNMINSQPQAYQLPPFQSSPHYPPKQPVYNQQGGYNPPQGGYQQGGYQHNPQQGYPQQGGYNPPQQQAYNPPQQGGYNPLQPGGYNPQQGGYQQHNSQQQGFGGNGQSSVQQLLAQQVSALLKTASQPYSPPQQQQTYTGYQPPPQYNNNYPSHGGGGGGFHAQPHSQPSYRGGMKCKYFLMGKMCPYGDSCKFQHF